MRVLSFDGGDKVVMLVDKVNIINFLILRFVTIFFLIYIVFFNLYAFVIIWQQFHYSSYTKLDFCPDSLTN